MRTPSLVMATLALAACGSDSRAPSAEPSAVQANRGPDAVLLRVPRAGGRAAAYLYPNLDSAVWRSGGSVPALDRVLAFDGEGGLLAAVDAKGVPTRIDLRLGTVWAASKVALTSIASADGVAIFGVAPTGEVTRLTPSGEDWAVRLPVPPLAIAPQRDGAILVAARRGAEGIVWRIRPPNTRVGDSALVGAATRVVSAQGGDRIYFADGRALSGVQTRNLEPLAQVRFDAPVHALAATPSGDRFYATLEGSDELRVLDRYSNAIVASIALPAVPSDLRVDPLGRFVLARASKGDSAWVIAVATDRLVGSVPTVWRSDLPLVLPDGAILTAVGDDAIVRDGASLDARRTIAGGASDLWHLVMWNGFRPRAAGLDKPVEFQTGEPSIDPLADSTDVDSTGAARDSTHPDTTSHEPEPPRRAPGIGVAEAQAAVALARGYTVQFAAAASEREARRIIKQLRLAKGLEPRIVPTTRDERTLYRVVVGPFATRAQAERVGKASGHDYWIYEGAP